MNGWTIPGSACRAMLLASLAGFLASGAVAQESAGNAESRAQKRIEDMRERLQLTDQQVEQLRPVFEQGAQRRREVLDSFDVDRSDMQASVTKLSGTDKARLQKEMRVIGKETRTQLEEILSEEQLELYGKLVQEQRAELRKQARKKRK